MEQTPNQQTPHKRRVHYSGKYPKKFEEKYKEQNPEKYADTVAHVIEKGSTPSGQFSFLMTHRGWLPPRNAEYLSFTPR